MIGRGDETRAREIAERVKRGQPPAEWGPKCAGCGADEFRIDGYCSIECRDYHQDEDVEWLLAELAAARQENEQLRKVLERIGLGVAGRLESGLRDGEGEDYLPTQPKSDWALARAALAAVTDNEPREETT